MHKIAIVVYPKFSLLDLSCMTEVFNSVNRNSPKYSVSIYSSEGGKCVSEDGLSIYTLSLQNNVSLNSYQTIIVMGGVGYEKASQDKTLIDRISSLNKNIRIVAICSGIFLLAYAGILRNKTVTTHWTCMPQFKKKFPKINISDKSLYIHDGNILSSAGGISGIDLAIYIVKYDFGKILADKTAKHLIILSDELNTSTNKSLSYINLKNSRFQKLLKLFHENLNITYSVEHLADTCHMSLRNFNRQFKKEFGVTPKKYLEIIRIEKSKELFNQNKHLSLEQVAYKCGFASSISFSRAFKRNMNITPKLYLQTL